MATALFFALLAFGDAARAEPSQLKIWNGPASTFTLADSQGAAHALSVDPAMITIVHFFATWCEPCREELPALSRLARRAGPTVRVIAISVAEPDLRVRRFLKTFAPEFPVLLDRDRTTARAWKATVLPTSFVLDGALKPLRAAETSVDWDRFEPREFLETGARSALAR
ncbi:MAG: TlpA family protein disulfide reductase [Rhodoblastus sp.]|nr:TlpA family protein disulfide reductase [Rhodoblastus sp.]